MTGLCQYKSVFGKLGEGIHEYKLFELSVVDTVGTLLGALLFSYFTDFSAWKSILVFFILGILFHRMFCVRTTIDKYLFPIVTE